MRKHCSSDREKISKFETAGRGFAKVLRSQTTICSNSETSEQCLVTECFLTCSWRYVSDIRYDRLEQLKFKLEKNIEI